MEITEAKELLNLCERSELRDHAFGDREVFWDFAGVEVAWGYFGRDSKEVSITDYEQARKGMSPSIASFEDDEAYELVKCGRVKAIERNDMQGDDIPDYRGA